MEKTRDNPWWHKAWVYPTVIILLGIMHVWEFIAPKNFDRVTKKIIGSKHN